MVLKEKFESVSSHSIWFALYYAVSLWSKIERDWNFYCSACSALTPQKNPKSTAVLSGDISDSATYSTLKEWNTSEKSVQVSNKAEIIKIM